METIKLIDLLIENSKGNHPNFRFKHTKNMIWKWDGCWYLCGASELDATFRVLGQLNEEIEILEDTPKIDDAVLRRYFTDKEDKKIEKFKVIKDNSGDSVQLIYDGMKLELTLLQAIIIDKLNEIIDRLNGEDNE